MDTNDTSFDDNKKLTVKLTYDKKTNSYQNVKVLKQFEKGFPDNMINEVRDHGASTKPS